LRIRTRACATAKPAYCARYQSLSTLFKLWLQCLACGTHQRVVEMEVSRRIRPCKRSTFCSSMKSRATSARHPSAHGLPFQCAGMVCHAVENQAFVNERNGLRRLPARCLSHPSAAPTGVEGLRLTSAGISTNQLHTGGPGCRHCTRHWGGELHEEVESGDRSPWWARHSLCGMPWHSTHSEVNSSTPMMDAIMRQFPTGCGVDTSSPVCIVSRQYLLQWRDGHIHES